MIKKKKVKSLPKLRKECLDLLAEREKLKAELDNRLFCYTCDVPLKNHTTNCQLGHYLARGAYPGLAFHPDNSRLQCFPCNIGKHGNIIEFRERLIKEIGLQRVTMLEQERHLKTKLGRSDYLEMIERFKVEIKELNA